MSFFTKLSAAVKTFSTSVNENVVIVQRSGDPVEVQPGLTAFESAVNAKHLNDDQEAIATFTIIHLDGSEAVVAGSYVCLGGEKLVVSVNRDGKGAV